MGQYFWADVFLRVLHIIFFYPTRHHAYRIVIFATMICLAWSIYLAPQDRANDPPLLTYDMGIRIGFYFGFMTYLLFAEGSFPDHWRRVRDEVDPAADRDAGGLNKLPSNFPLTKKLRWMLDLSHNPRMIGWVQEPRGSLPPHPSPSRRTFLWKTSVNLVANAVVADFMSSLLALSRPFHYYYPQDPTRGPDTYLTAIPFLRRVPYVLSCGIGTGAPISVVHSLMGLMFVGVGNASPTLLPDMWGSWGDAYTVRKLWGQTWHQTWRPMLAGLGRLVANKFLKFPRGTNRSSYTQLYVAFLISGIIHASADYMIEKRLVYRSFEFFLLQAVAITFEDFVIYIAKGLLRRGGIEIKPGKADETWAGVTVRVIGYCWVTLWFCLTLPAWVDGLGVAGVYSFYRGGPISRFVWGRWKQWA